MASYRSRLQFSLVGLGLAAIAAADWQASIGAEAALRQGTYERLTAIRETKRRVIEDYFQDAANHVLALSTDEATISALEQFRVSPIPPRERFGSLLDPPGTGAYGKVHARYHPTLFRYLTAFGFYDILLIDASDGRVLYSVIKESDFGRRAGQPPLDDTGLARSFRRALEVTGPETAVIEDYAPYPPSGSVPAAFVAAPIWRAGSKAGVLAIQISTVEVSRVMTGNRNWEGEGLGQTGQAYLIGADSKLRSDSRFDENAILRSAAPAVEGKIGTEIGVGLRGEPALRSHAALDIPGLNWQIVAEIDSSEAFASIPLVRRRTLATGAVVAVIFFAAAWLLGRAVTEPVLALTAGARRLGGGDFTVRLPTNRADEIGQLAASFNRMAEDLQRTTVSRDELERLNERLIHAHEEERARIGRELHDDLTQRIAAIAIAAGRLKRSPHEAPEGLARIQQDLARLSDDVHGLSRRLHPAVLDDLGLAAAIEIECRAAFERGAPVIDFTHEGSFDSLPDNSRLALYRIVQEALTNVVRHSGATEASVSLRQTAGGVALEIRDNGQGFDGAGGRSGLGLASMNERARHAGGVLTIDTAPGRGTLVRVTIAQ